MLDSDVGANSSMVISVNLPGAPAHARESPCPSAPTNRSIHQPALLALTSDCLVIGTSGPLRAGCDSSMLCTPAPAKGFAAVGDVVHTDGSGDLTITQVELVRAARLTHEDSYIMLIEGMDDEDRADQRGRLRLNTRAGSSDAH